jgi:hypothetical protein
MKYFLFLLLAIALPAVALNTMPNCGVVVGSSMPDVNIATAMTPIIGSDQSFISAQVQTPKQNTDGTGQARFPIKLVAMTQNDIVVYPNIQNATHTHYFWGNSNAALSARTNPANLRTNCKSLAAGGAENCSGYWSPVVVDTLNDSIVPVSDLSAYYKSAGQPSVFDDPIQVPPLGLRMITGDATASTPVPVNTNPSLIRFSCLLPDGITWVVNSATGQKFFQNIPACPNGGQVHFMIQFPNCWDGVNLDSPNHKTHMTFKSSNLFCPATHPIRIPQIAYNYSADVTSLSGTAAWRLSSDNYPVNGYNAGYSYHADWVNGWNPTTIQTFVTECLNRARDCHSQNLGDGTRLIPVI